MNTLPRNTTAIMFPGQGSQYVGMGAELALGSPAARAVFAAADDQLRWPLSRLCWDGPAAELNATQNTQPALYVCSLAALAALREHAASWQPAFAAGHSLGEITALAAAGALKFADGLQLVCERGRLMQLAGERQPGSMAAVVGASAAVVRAICAQATAESGLPVTLANDNCPGQVVMSGHLAALERATKLLRSAGFKRVLPIKISVAAHSPLMASVQAEYAAVVAATPVQAPQVPVIANASAAPMLDAAAVRAELQTQLTTVVRWTESMQALLAAGVKHFVELGPHTVLCGLLKRIDSAAARYALGTPADLPALQQLLAA